MHKANTWIYSHIEKIIIGFFLLGPFFDCITAFSIHVLHTSFTGIIMLKILFLALLLYDLFFVSKCRYKNKIIIWVLLILTYSSIFILQVVLQKGLDTFLYECQGMVRAFFFPITLLCLYNLYRENRFTPKINYIYWLLVFYLLFIFIPLITHTGFDSYAYSKVGSVGWFYSCNEIGGILSILFPFIFKNLLSQRKWILVTGMLILLGVYLSIGTKVPILSILITIILFGTCYIINLIQTKKWQQFSSLIITGIVGIIALILIIPKTSFYKNIQIHLEFLEIDSITDLLTIEKIDHFIFSERIRFLGKTSDNYLKAPWNQWLFGIGYIENYGTDNVNTKLIEIDYYDILFRHGIIGSIIYFTPFIWILVQFIKKMKVKPNLTYITSILFVILLSLFSGHILVSPSVSIVVTFTLILSLKGGNPNENEFSNGKLQ